MTNSPGPFGYFWSRLLLTIAFILIPSLPAMAGQSRDGALFVERSLDSTHFYQDARFAGNPDSTGWHSNRFTKPGYLTGMSTRLLAKNGPAPAGDAASAPGAPGGPSGSHQDSLGEVGAKLSNPASNIWALFTEFDLTFSDGDVNLGDPKVGGAMLFQPIMPIPLFGTGANQWKLIMRPTIPFIFSTALPKGLNRYDRITGMGDTVLPLPLVAPTGNWLLGLGPTFTLPTSTERALGRQQWEVGPTAIVGYKTKKWILGMFPQYYFGIGSRGDQDGKPDASHGSLLYFGWINLPEAWQVGFNPVVTYEDKAISGNKWNVPFGPSVTKTTKVGGMPVKFQLGAEYSVVSQDTFGRRFLLKLNIIPVIESLVTDPLFGGN